jgi:hypothetical protein
LGCLVWKFAIWQRLYKFLGHFIPRKEACINLNKKWLVLHFGRVFSQTHLVTLLGTYV